MRVVLKKSVARAICRYWGFPIVLKSVRDPKLEYFKRKILAHLEKLERKEKAQMRKSLAYLERLEKAQKRNVGDIVTWGQKHPRKYIKGADGKWRQYYEGTSRGQKLSIAALKRKVDVCKDVGELWDLVFANWGRFMDADKMPLPVVRELHAYASKREDEIKAGGIDKPKPQKKGGRKQKPLAEMNAAELEKVVESTGKQIERDLKSDKKTVQLLEQVKGLEKERQKAKDVQDIERGIQISRSICDLLEKLEEYCVATKPLSLPSRMKEAADCYKERIETEEKTKAEKEAQELYSKMTDRELRAFIKENKAAMNKETGAEEIKKLYGATFMFSTEGEKYVHTAIKAKYNMLHTKAWATYFYRINAASDELTKRKAAAKKKEILENKIDINNVTAAELFRMPDRKLLEQLNIMTSSEVKTFLKVYDYDQFPFKLSSWDREQVRAVRNAALKIMRDKEIEEKEEKWWNIAAEKRKRLSKEADEALKRVGGILQEFDFVKNGQIKDEDLKYFAYDYEKLTPEYKAIFEKHAKHLRTNLYLVPTKGQPTGFFSVDTNTINLNIAKPHEESVANGFITNMMTFIHEAGHWFDWNMLSKDKNKDKVVSNDNDTVRSHLFRLRDTLRRDFLDFVDNKLAPDGTKSSGVSSLSSKKLSAYRNFLHNKDGDSDSTKGAVSDIAYALAGGADLFPSTWAHRKSYWKKDALEKETVANFFECYGSDDKCLLHIKEVFPNAYKLFENYIKTL